MVDHLDAGPGGGLRRRVYAVLAVLTAAWAVGAFAAVQEAVQVFRTRAVGTGVGRPTDMVIGALQEERRLSVTYLSYPDSGDGRLRAQRSRTDAAVATLLRRSQAGYVRPAAGKAVRENADRLVQRLGTLPVTRDAVDARRLDRALAIAAYTELVDAAFQVYDSSWLWPEPLLVASGRALVALARAREALAYEDAFVRGALATGHLADADRVRLGQLVGAQRALHREAAGGLAPAQADRYRRLADQAPFTGLRALEDRLAATPAPGAPVAGVDAWSATAEPVLAALQEFVRAGARDTAAAATPAAVRAVVRAGLVGGLGLVALTVLVRTTRTALRRPRRRRTSALLLDLSRRNQALLHRQLRLLDAMERRESDADALAELFRVDHLATRIRRNVEKGILLAGAIPGRRWRQAVPLIDVVRGAVAEVDQYQRVDVSAVEAAALHGPAVTDVTHLLAELIENATVFSPADTTVWVSGTSRPGGYAIVVSDQGTGIAGSDLVAANDLLAGRASATAATGHGLYAAGQFARRHGIRVELHPAPRRGVRAEVLLPPAIVASGPDRRSTSEPREAHAVTNPATGGPR